jgi:hypothetical protein
MSEILQAGQEQLINYLGYRIDGTPGYSSPPESTHKFKTPAAYELLSQLEAWRYEARTAHAENRREQAVDADYYDGIQRSIDELRELEDRGQPPITLNFISQQVLWLLGTERRTRVEAKVSPRSKEDESGAQVKTKVL